MYANHICYDIHANRIIYDIRVIHIRYDMYVNHVFMICMLIMCYQYLC